MDKTAFFLALVLMPFYPLLSQENVPFPYAERQLKDELTAMRTASDEQERLGLSDRFAADLALVLSMKGSFKWPFDSLAGITAVTSPDGCFRIFTWPVSMADGHFRYYGVMQTAPRKGDPARVFRFTDRADSIADPSGALLSSDNWFGAVYYQVILTKMPDRSTVYTVLGWRGADQLVSSRLIEILILAPEGPVVFGSAIFCNGLHVDTRLIFRYSAKATMVLTYEKQAVVTDKKWNASSRSFETERTSQMMIVLDRLVPMDPQMEGRYEYYVPSSDVMDGYIFTGGCWKLVTGIDARNPYQKPKPPPKSRGK